MFHKTYIVANVHGKYIYWQSKPYKQKAAVIKEYERQNQINPTNAGDLKILKAQWVEAELEVD